MHRSSMLPAFWGSLLVMILVQVVEGLPLVNRARQIITLPLKRVEQAQDMHGQIYLQLHINQALRRLARLTRRQEPTNEELRANLERRINSIEGLDISERRSLEKRYSRIGVPKRGKPIVASVNTGTKPRQSNGRKNKGSASQAAGGKKASGNSTQSGNTNGSTGNGNAGSVLNGVSLANTPTANNSLGLDIEAHDVGYLATIQLGTPPRDFLVLMDSGSGDLWVGAENCQADTGGSCGPHNFLGPKNSSTFVDTKVSFQITYGTGSVSGDVITDNLALGDLKLPNHPFGVATTESVQFFSDTVPFDGLMGLANSINSEQKVLTPVEALAKANLISEPIVSYKISRLADNLNDGEITFGGLDTTKFDPKTLVSLPNINQRGLWEADLGTVSVNGKDTGVQGRSAILDTGTSLLAIPLNDATAIHALINGSNTDGQGGFSVPCTLTDQVSLEFGQQTFAIDPRDIAVAPLDPTNPEGDCISGIIATSISGINDTQWLVGDVFLKNPYFSTDVSKNTLSLAKLVEMSPRGFAGERYKRYFRSSPTKFDLHSSLLESLSEQVKVF